MNRKLILTLTMALTLLIAPKAKATHYLGGELTWSCNANGTYTFTCKVYRDCGGSTFFADPINISYPGGTFSLPRVSITDITPTCGGTALLNCSQNPPQQSGAVQEHLYRNTNVTLSSGPIPWPGWTFTTQQLNARPPCRNLQNCQSDLVLRAKMYPYTLPNGVRANPSTCYDNSPRFLASPTSIICAGYKFYYNHLAGDVELDSLYYAWDYPISTTGGNQLQFSSGYSSTAPFPDQTENPANGPITLNGNTGQMTVEAYNPTPGNYISVIRVEAWKNCQLKAEVFRDIAVVYSTDARCSGNNPPATNIDLTAWPRIKQRGDNYYTSVYPGDTVRFRMTATENDLNGFQLQLITLTVANDEIGSPITSQSGCLSGKGPCAQLTRIGGSSFANQTAYIEGEFLWIPGCSHLATIAGCKGKTSTYPFAFRVQDNACPANAIGVVTVVVDVLAGDPNPVDFKCASVLDQTTQDIELTWEQPPVDSGLFWNYYLIYADDGTGNFVVLDTITDYNQLRTTITPAMMPTGTTKPSSFYIVHSDTSRAGCEFFSLPSDTLAPMVLNFQQLGGVVDSVSLNWTPLYINNPPGNIAYYEVYSELPLGSGVYKFLGTTTDTFYEGNLPVCNDSVQARMLVHAIDPSTNCISVSFQTPGVFSARPNPDILRLDSVTVDPATGLSTLSWMPSERPNVARYRILFEDPNIGWTVIDSVPYNITTYQWGMSQAGTRAEKFRVVSVDSCNKQSDANAVVAHRTVYLRHYLNRCDNTLRLNWTSYRGFPGGVNDYRLYYVETDINGNVGPKTLVFTGTASDTVTILRNLNSGSQYCFTVQAYDTSLLKSSTSNEICFDAAVTIKSKELYVATVTYVPDRNALAVKFFVDGNADVSQFEVQRALDRFGPWRNVAVLGKPTMPPNKLMFTDFGASSDISYYYRVVAGDSCGGLDTVSNIGRNIVLRVQPNADLGNNLNWTPYEKWDGEVGRYDIYRSTDNGLTYALVGSNPGGDTSYTDDISAFANDQNEYCYYIVAVEANNPMNYVDDDGQAFRSRSNFSCAKQKVKMYMPSAFRPDSPFEANRSFGPSVRFEDVRNYRLLVLNRWGAALFETTDPTVRWDGTKNGVEVPSGVYIYKLQYATEGGPLLEEEGSFTLLR